MKLPNVFRSIRFYISLICPTFTPALRNTRSDASIARTLCSNDIRKFFGRCARGYKLQRNRIHSNVVCVTRKTCSCQNSCSCCEETSLLKIIVNFVLLWSPLRFIRSLCSGTLRFSTPRSTSFLGHSFPRPWSLTFARVRRTHRRNITEPSTFYSERHLITVRTIHLHQICPMRTY